MNAATKIHRDGQQAILTMAATVRRIWTQACQHDGLDPKGSFVVFSDTNPYVKWHGRAIQELQRMKTEYDAGGYVGLTLDKGKVVS